ncbi:MAG TPA: ABC transporter ATP-binding protein [Methylomirabilota bacterium]
MTAAGAAVRLEHVTKAFDGFVVLDDLTLEVASGSACCILGRSGTGKSVALKHIVGLLRPDRGRVFVGGVDVTSLSSREMTGVRRGIGFVFQNAALFDSISVGENVAFPLRRHTRLPEAEIRARAGERLRQVGLEEAFDKLPATLSGGMRKRAGLARAMALDPPLLLVDEPSAGLDPITSAEIDALLLRVKREQGATLVVVTHNVPSARAIGDDLVFLHEGRVLARGPAAELDHSADPLVRAFMRSEGSG